MFTLAQSSINFRSTSSYAPGKREAGANRSGACVQDDNGLVALLPENNLAATTEAYPSIYAYFPSTSAQYAEFALYEEGSNDLVYGILFKVTGRSSLVRVEMPNTATFTPLQIGHKYYWYLSLICNVSDRSNDITVQGNFSRVDVSEELIQKLSSTPPQNYPSVYAEAGLWPETVASLLELNQDNRGNPKIQQDFSDLLRSVGLTSVADRVLLP
ncbi:MAG: DUF928 domain-containing protein [Xenococcaceae cyanobacterium MO_188.B32]|nr:DUF928 domain-containing protein [Xenococcaceae cyanobacterium MO_188.B32]